MHGMFKWVCMNIIRVHVRVRNESHRIGSRLMYRLSDDDDDNDDDCTTNSAISIVLLH